MNERTDDAQVHPGSYIKKHVIPEGMAVKAAAQLIGVGRPALSNLLHGKAALSPEMAVRLEKTFGADKDLLLRLQSEFEQVQLRSRDQEITVRTYVPAFLKITARDLDKWIDGNPEARYQLPVLLRKLVNSTGQALSLVDFPGYENAERKGWDGRVDAGGVTPWVPIGKSGWEFGCNEEPKQKADGDYATRVKSISPIERAEMTFVFVTPRKWNAKDQWAKGKQATGDWKFVRAYDGSDLEQWLEQSIQAQAWLAKTMGSTSDGVDSLEEQWRKWATATVPELPRQLFATSVEHYKGTVKTWIENPPSSPLIVCGDSKLEALAFLYCLFETDDPAFMAFKDRLLVFSSADALRKLTTASPSFLPIVFTDAVERELGGVYKKTHTIIVRPRNTIESQPTIVLDLLRDEPFRKALEAMGINDHLKADDLARESGHSPTILRRRLSKITAILTPPWTVDPRAVRSLIPMMMVGTWHTQSRGDCEILSFLAGTNEQVEKDVTELLRFDDSPVWSVGKFRGVASKIDAFFTVQAAVTPKDLKDFLFAAQIVLSEEDPALELPEDKRAFANLYGKAREHSGALRDGICETLVLLAVHGNDLFQRRVGIDVQRQVDNLIRELLTPLTPEKLLSQTGNLPLYAEAAPGEFLQIIEEDLKSPEPQVFALMKPADSAIFGGGCPRTGLLWALENLAWKSEQLPRVSSILARLAERKIEDNWANKPESSLEAVFCSWMPQTAATLEERQRTLALLTKKFPAVGWRICVSQFAPGRRVGVYSHRPRWRSDASGAGQPLSWPEIHTFGRAALDLALAWPSHDENTLGDLVANLRGVPGDQQTVWNLINNWAATETDERRKAVLRERIRRFAFLRRSANRGLKSEVRDCARHAYDLLTPVDLVTRHEWLFAQHWVEESFDEIEDPELDYGKQHERTRQLRIDALREIWSTEGFDGIKSLLARSGAAWTIGGHLAEEVIESAKAASFLETCLAVEEPELGGKFNEVIRGLLTQLPLASRLEITQPLLKVLSPVLRCRFLKCSPFEHATWLHVDDQSSEIREQYWREIHSHWLPKESPDLNEVIDRLLEVRRPRAAFQAVQFAFEEIETSRLKRLLQEVGTCDSEPPGTYQFDTYHLSAALNTLQGRAGVTEEEMARLEFLFITALEHSEHQIPNLERQVGKSPALFVQALALVYRRRDGGEDPPAWQVTDSGQKASVGTAAYRLLEDVNRIPGTDDKTDKINEDELKAWVTEVQALCRQYGRAQIGDQRIGQFLSSPIVGADEVWPCEQVRKVLEECGTSDMATGVQIGVSNSRGFHMRGEGGEQERDLAAKYRNWARKLLFEYPYVSNLVKGIASNYDREAEMEDSEAAVRRRLRQ